MSLLLMIARTVANGENVLVGTHSANSLRCSASLGDTPSLLLVTFAYATLSPLIPRGSSSAYGSYMAVTSFIIFISIPGSRRSLAVLDALAPGKAQVAGFLAAADNVTVTRQTTPRWWVVLNKASSEIGGAYLLTRLRLIFSCLRFESESTVRRVVNASSEIVTGQLGSRLSVLASNRFEVLSLALHSEACLNDTPLIPYPGPADENPPNQMQKSYPIVFHPLSSRSPYL
ncbi:hypothetical protein L210DRAFT_3509160 [Boletus edulis BED1]|uniref:Uncharacterized protein n=1 Tax=Boletus edulis BED1 TaxID=1328754 RepID=A0AAD4G8K7_BOLED|nr:hypothetical protein L210DRAFT_3509160 [Boletus edulis BED1]